MLTSLFILLQTMAVAAARQSLTLLLLASVALNVALSEQIRASRLQAGLPSRGTSLPPMRGTTGLSGPVETASTDLPTVFYYFSASCGWCERNWSNVEALAKQTVGRYQVVAVAATDEIPSVVSERFMPLSVLTRVDSNTLDLYGFRGTPQTVVVGSDGRVLESWTGAYQDDQKRQIERFFKVRLPGVLEGRATR